MTAAAAGAAINQSRLFMNPSIESDIRGFHN